VNGITGIDYRMVPIIINSYNRVACLKNLVNWLTNNGYRNLIVLDNASSYIPLIEYYSYAQRHNLFQLIRLNGNYGHLAIWEANIISALNIHTEYVYTDSDVIPDSVCPSDLVQYLQNILYCNDEITKVGLSLRVDDIPDTNKHKKIILLWEKQLWKHPLARGLMLAGIDTTFALYRPQGQHDLGNNNVRTTWPYLGRHDGWYIDFDNFTEEQVYYNNIRAKSSNWSMESLPDHIVLAAERIESKSPYLLHLGCGRDYFHGWINIDNIGSNCDIIFDLNSCRSKQLPIADSSVDGFYMSHLLEHISDTLSLMQELHRIAKPGARLVARLPYGSSSDAWEDPTHVRPYFENSFVYFEQPAYSRAEYGYQGDWDIEKIVLVLPKSLHGIDSDAMLNRIASLRNQVTEMIVFLKAIKPIRAKNLSLMNKPKVEMKYSPLIFEPLFW
jgi:SAM-dependent methyltransferase